jgi:hypothetical protein
MGSNERDSWTRRRLGWAAGGLAALAGLAPVGDSAGRKRKKHVRCRTLLQTCESDGKQDRCCAGLNCDPLHDFDGLRCCLGRRQRCSGGDQCCANTSCLTINGLDGQRCCGRGGVFCRSNLDCCSEFICTGGQCLPPP